MRPAEQGFLLLTSHLGDPDRPVLTIAQLRNLAMRIRSAQREAGDQDITREILMGMGYAPAMAERIVTLLDGQEQMQWYLRRGARQNCLPIARISAEYPDALRKGLELEAPGCLWAKGDLSLLEKPKVSLVGSRELKEENRRFAAEAGKQAARQGYVLVSGNAKGADRTAQDACLGAGGQVISVVADTLADKPNLPGVLWLSEDGYDLPFTAQRALSRNRVIHCLGSLTLVAQSDLGKGGTWDGTQKNLRYNWSPVGCFADGSPAFRELTCMGAAPVEIGALEDFVKLAQDKPVRIEF